MTTEQTAEARPAPGGKAATEYFVRFTLNQRVEHIVLMITFTVLSVTGLAQRFYPAGWAEWVILNLGGIGYTRLFHRIFALAFTLSVAYHFSYVGYALFVRHGRASMVPTLKDFRDVVGAVRYGLGFSARPPQFGRYDYRQKFEYWGMMFGSMIIIITGFFLAFPVAVTRVLPGQVIAASVEFHGFEATLAVLTIVIWHLYDVIFKPGIFPADTTIFTGKISRKRMAEEHALEYLELVGERTETPPASPAEKPVAESQPE
ncbi:MAG: cytochrome b/b6 domain-containing protein [Dehalococcoidales bacterium]|nr:cytochrome b/b6 domain-containing protein [Dehalococcoidales bacterium]